MAVDYSLKPFWLNAFLWNQTKDKVWLDLIKITAATDKGPSGRAAQKALDVA
jgi:hypothetical protein